NVGRVMGPAVRVFWELSITRTCREAVSARSDRALSSRTDAQGLRRSDAGRPRGHAEPTARVAGRAWTAAPRPARPPAAHGPSEARDGRAGGGEGSGGRWRRGDRLRAGPG